MWSLISNPCGAAQPAWGSIGAESTLIAISQAQTVLSLRFAKLKLPSEKKIDSLYIFKGIGVNIFLVGLNISLEVTFSSCGIVNLS
jgi:hypothetical protein